MSAKREVSQRNKVRLWTSGMLSTDRENAEISEERAGRVAAARSPKHRINEKAPTGASGLFLFEYFSNGLYFSIASFRCLAQASAELRLPCVEASWCTEYAQTTSPLLILLTVILASSRECQLPKMIFFAAPAF